MPDFKTVIVERESAVERRLAELGVSSEQIISVGRKARARHDDASPLMPINAPGSLAYIYGVEEMRHQIIDQDWVADRKAGVEAVVNRKLGIRIAYQNVDKACCPLWKPHPRSAKGTGSENLCGPTLFEYYGIDQGPLTSVASDGLSTYYIMVAEDGGIELSCPIIENKTFSNFLERIFVLDTNEKWEEDIDRNDGPIVDFDIDITFKEKT